MDCDAIDPNLYKRITRISQRWNMSYLLLSFEHAAQGHRNCDQAGKRIGLLGFALRLDPSVAILFSTFAFSVTCDACCLNALALAHSYGCPVDGLEDGLTCDT